MSTITGMQFVELVGFHESLHDCVGNHTIY